MLKSPALQGFGQLRGKRVFFLGQWFFCVGLTLPPVTELFACGASFPAFQVPRRQVSVNTVLIRICENLARVIGLVKVFGLIHPTIRIQFVLENDDIHQLGLVF